MDLSKGYQLASQAPQPYEYVPLAPAGGSALTGEDMAKFMIAQLQDGQMGSARILRPQTARYMHRRAPAPPLNRMALGFAVTDVNGRREIDHSGATQWFLSNLQLYLDDRVGVFVSINSRRRDGAAGKLITVLGDRFADRYLPGSPPAGHVDSALAKRHSRMMAGLWENSRRSSSSFLAVLGLLGASQVVATADGAMTLPQALGPNGRPFVWREVAPFVWRDASGKQLVTALVRNGAVARFAISPAAVLQRVPWWRSPVLFAPLLIAASSVLALTLLAWPVWAVIRRRAGARFDLSGRAAWAHRLTRIAAAAVLALILAWAATVMAISSNGDLLSGRLDGWILALNGAGLVVFVGAAALAAWNACLVWREGRRWPARLWSAILAAACLIVLWVAFAFRLLAFTVNY